MADEIIQTSNAPEGVPAEVHQLMQAALTGIAPASAQVINTSIADTPPVANQQISPNIPATSIPNTEEQIFDADEYIKSSLGFDNMQVAKTEIEILRQKANAQPATPSYKFDNETIDTIFKALQSGELTKVHSALDQQIRIDKLIAADVNKDTAADIIKLGMQLELKDLTPEEINYKYNKQYGAPKEPVQTTMESDEDFEIRQNEWKEVVADIEMNRVIEAKVMKPRIAAAKNEIKFPQSTQQVDEDYIQYKKSLEARPQVEAEIREIYKKITPEVIGTKLPFNDEANKIAFEFQYLPDGDSFSKSVDMALNVDKFLDTFYSSDGQFDNAKFVSALHFALNKDAYLLEAMKQAKNATIKASLPDNTTGGLQRQMMQTHEPTELDKQMNFALQPFMKNGNGARVVSN